MMLVGEKAAIDRENFIRLIRKWGGVNTDGLLEEKCLAFMIPDVEGFIGYRVENDHAVVFGNPVCSPEDQPNLAHAFQKHCESENLGVVYTIISPEFAKWCLDHLSATIIEFGENFILDPSHNPTKEKGSNAVLVRKKVKHALRDGVTVHEYKGNEPHIEEQISALAATWVDKRKGPQIYLAHVHIFEDRLGKRWFYAMRDGQVVGFLVLNELEHKKGWLLNNVMLSQKAPGGVSELLVISTLEILEKENCRYVIAGPVTAKTLGKMEGINPALAQLIRLVFKGAKMLFHLEGYGTYWQKFNPKMEGSFLAFPNRGVSYSSIKSLVRAFNSHVG